MTVGGGENKGTTFCILVNAWLLVGSHHCSTDVMLSVTAGLSQSIVVDLIKLLQLVRGLFFLFKAVAPSFTVQDLRAVAIKGILDERDKIQPLKVY